MAVNFFFETFDTYIFIKRVVVHTKFNLISFHIIHGSEICSTFYYFNKNYFKRH